MFNIFFKKTRAFSGIEILLSVSILGLISVSLIGLLFYGQSSIRTENLSAEASLLANRSILAVSSIRDRSFDELVDGVHGLTNVSSEFYLSGSSDEVGPFTRTITISSDGGSVKKVSISITWLKSPARIGRVLVSRYFTNWQNAESYDCEKWFGDDYYFLHHQVDCDKGDLVLKKTSDKNTYSGLESNGNSLKFNSSSDYIQTNINASNLNIDGNKPRTIEVWAMTELFNGAGLFSFGSPAVNGMDFSLRTLHSSDSWRVQLWGPADIDFTYESSNKWVHFALVHDGMKTSVYADGNLITEREQVLNTVANQDLAIAWWPYFDLPRTFNGRIREFRVWDKALSQLEIQENIYNQLNGNESNLVAYWPLDEGWGSTVVDRVGSSVGTLVNNPIWVKDYLDLVEYFTDGHRVSSPYSLDEFKNVTSSNVSWLTEEHSQGRSLILDGLSDYARIANSTSLNPQEFLSLAAWVKWNIDPENGQDWTTIISKNNDNQYRLQHSRNNDAFEFAIRTDSGGRWVLSNTEPVIDRWYFVVGTYDGSQLKIYVDGQLENSLNYSGGNITNSSSDLFIGRRSGGGRNFNGYLNNISIWSKALSDADVLGIYEGSLDVANESGLISYYQFNEDLDSLDVLDSSVNGNDGVLDFSSSPPYRQDVFSGINMYAALSESDTVEPNFPDDYSLLENDSPIIGINEGDNLSNKYLWLRQELLTDNPYLSPRLKNLSFQIESDDLVEADQLVIDKSGSQVGTSPNRDLLEGTKISNINSGDIFIEEVKLNWSEVHTNTRLESINLNGVGVWSGNANSGDSIVFSPFLTIEKGLSPYDISFKFNRNIPGIDLIVQFFMSDGSMRSSHLTSGNFEVEVEITSDWNAAYCADVTISSQADNPVVWEAVVVLDSYPLNGEPYNVWGVNWTYNDPILTATGENHNDTVSLGNPVTFGYCANRPEGSFPEGDVDFEVVIVNDWNTGYCADVNITTESVTPVSWEVFIDLSNYPVNGTPSSVWSANWTFNNPVLTASGLSWNETVSSSSPTSFGYCADRPPPEEADFLSVNKSHAVIGGSLNNRNVSGVFLENNSSNNVVIDTLNMSWTGNRRLRGVYIADSVNSSWSQVWSGNSSSAASINLNTYQLNQVNGPYNLRLEFNNNFSGNTISDLNFVMSDGSIKNVGAISF